MYKHATLVFDGAIGEFAMVLSFLKAVHQLNPDFKALILTSRNIIKLKMIATSYPYVKIIERKGFISQSKILAELYGKKSLILSGVSFALKDGEKIDLYKSALALISFGMKSTFVYQKEEEIGSNICYDFEQTFFQNLCKNGKFLNAPNISQWPPLFKYTNDRYFLDKYNLNHDFVVMHLFGSSPERTLPLPRWQTVIKYIREKYPTLKILITGGPKDSTAINQLLVDDKTITLAGEGDFMKEATMYDNSKLFIGVDTGPTHLASLLQKNVVQISNNSNPTWLPTYNKNINIITNKEHCTCDSKKGGNCKIEINGLKYYRCMYEITDEQIFTAIDKVLS